MGRKSKARRKQESDPSEAAKVQQPAREGDAPAEFRWEHITPKMVVIGSLILFSFVVAYWPTLLRLVRTWDTEPDYAHGYLVIPLALYALWVRQDTFPRGAVRWSWWGLLLLGAAVLTRWVGGRLYLDALDGWSIMLWVGGVCWLMGGWRFFLWTLPGIAFLWFMIPLPHAVETAMRVPLQKVATKLSCIILQCLGQPALVEVRNVIRLGEEELRVAEACSGLRIFVAIAVLAFAYILIVRPPWWEKLALILCVVPVALLSNATRIVVTGFVYMSTQNESTRQAWHDNAGLMMMPFAVGLFALILWYMSKLIKEVEVDMHGVFRQRTA